MENNNQQNYEELYKDLVNRAKNRCDEYINKQKNANVNDDTYYMNFIDGIIQAIQLKKIKFDFNKQYTLDDVEKFKNILREKESSLKNPEYLYENLYCYTGKQLLSLWKYYEQELEDVHFDPRKKFNKKDYHEDLCIQRINEIIYIFNKEQNYINPVSQASMIDIISQSIKERLTINSKLNEAYKASLNFQY